MERNYQKKKSTTTRYATSAKRTSKTRRKKKKDMGDYIRVIVGVVLCVVAIICIAYLIKQLASGTKVTEVETTEAVVEEVQLEKEVSVDGIAITGMLKSEAKSKILGEYPWNMSVAYDETVYQVPNLIEANIDALLEDIYSTHLDDTEYVLSVENLESVVEEEVAILATVWNQAPKNAAISAFDSSSNTFSFAGAEVGKVIDEAQLVEDIMSAMENKNFQEQFTVSVVETQPEISLETAKSLYKTISTYTTTTTTNSNRNTNVRLAAEAVNGTIIQPGEEFSFNGVVGQRTEARGFMGAAAYNNGEVVQEIGGGVCQVSSTMYNAVLQAGLPTTVRRSHTYEPSYVRPGTDATVSWEEPDYCFSNTSDTAIGILASYSDQKCTVSIYAIPILEEGITYELETEKLKDMPPPDPTYEEDQTIELDVEVIKSAGTVGSQWEARLVIKKDGVVISSEVDHTVTYKGHAPVILRNTSGVVITTEGEEESTMEEESTIAHEGAGDGFDPPEETSSSSVVTPGTTAAATAAPSQGVVERPGATETTGAVVGDGPGGSEDSSNTSTTDTTIQTIAPKPSDW